MPASAVRRHPAVAALCGTTYHCSIRMNAVPNITLLDLDALKKTRLRPYIEKCLEHRAPDPGFHAIMGHNIDLCEAMFVAWDTLFNTGRVSHTLKEIIRVQLSRMASCVY